MPDLFPNISCSQTDNAIDIQHLTFQIYVFVVLKNQSSDLTQTNKIASHTRLCKKFTVLTLFSPKI